VTGRTPGLLKICTAYPSTGVLFQNKWVKKYQGGIG